MEFEIIKEKISALFTLKNFTIIQNWKLWTSTGDYRISTLSLAKGSVKGNEFLRYVVQFYPKTGRMRFSLDYGFGKENFGKMAIVEKCKDEWPELSLSYNEQEKRKEAVRIVFKDFPKIDDVSDFSEFELIVDAMNDFSENKIEKFLSIIKESSAGLNDKKIEKSLASLKTAKKNLLYLQEANKKNPFCFLFQVGEVFGTGKSQWKIESITPELLNVVSPDSPRRIRPLPLNLIYEYVKYFLNNPSMREGSDQRDFIKEDENACFDKYMYGYDATLKMFALEFIKRSENTNFEDWQDGEIECIGVQKIFFGAPGTGKSHKIDAPENEGGLGLNAIPESRKFRTTFHPDYDYAQFVGSYKPVKRKEGLCEELFTSDELQKKAKVFSTGDHDLLKFSALYSTSLSAIDNKKNVVSGTPLIGDKNEQSVSTQMSNGIAVGSFLKEHFSKTSITYSFSPQVFANAYAAAWNNLNQPVYLVIEEINRGNCAQIFGDIFQLLDRDDEGYSRYEIDADADFAEWLESQIPDQVRNDVRYPGNGKLRLPPNLNILATMNTSDQSLFPMDSAFKRRFDWEYVPIKYEKDDDCGENWNADQFVIDLGLGDNNPRWLDFLEKVNDNVYDVTKSEDKQMGEFFVKPDVEKEVDGKKEKIVISLDMFKSKVLFYLWDSVYKDEVDDENAQKIFHFDYPAENGSAVTFQRLFKKKDDSLEIIKQMFKNLGVKIKDDKEP